MPGRRFGARGSGSTEHFSGNLDVSAQLLQRRGPETWFSNPTRKEAVARGTREARADIPSLGKSVFRRLAAAGRPSRGSPVIRCLPLYLFNFGGRLSWRYLPGFVNIRAEMFRWRPLIVSIRDVTTGICLAVTSPVVILATYHRVRRRVRWCV